MSRGPKLEAAQTFINCEPRRALAALQKRVTSRNTHEEQIESALPSKEDLSED